MFTIKIANMTVEIRNRYDYVFHFCKDYIVENVACADLSVEVTEEEILAEMTSCDFPITTGYAESVCVYRSICQKIPVLQEAFLFHGAVIECDGRGYVFAARSGTGKSTHIALWQKRFGSRVRVINGDKPIMRFEDGCLYAYGTPWCGKERLQTNASVPVAGICFLERAENNEIARIAPADAVIRVFQQVLTPTDLQSVDVMFPLLDRMLAQIPCYLLKCNMEEEAAEVSYYGMRENREEI